MPHRLLYEGQEEIGSPNLPSFLTSHAQGLLSGVDLVLNADGGQVSATQPGICTGGPVAVRRVCVWGGVRLVVCAHTTLPLLTPLQVVDCAPHPAVIKVSEHHPLALPCHDPFTAPHPQRYTHKPSVHSYLNIHTTILCLTHATAGLRGAAALEVTVATLISIHTMN
jgi:hypothetical protein